MESAGQGGNEAVEVVDSRPDDRIEIHAEGKLAGFAEYRREAERFAILHTEVDPHFGGRGFGARLIGAALEIARREGLAVLPFCPFARDFIADNHEYLDLVPVDQRDQFGLPENDRSTQTTNKERP